MALPYGNLRLYLKRTLKRYKEIKKPVRWEAEWACILQVFLTEDQIVILV